MCFADHTSFGFSVASASMPSGSLNRQSGNSLRSCSTAAWAPSSVVSDGTGTAVPAARFSAALTAMTRSRSNGRQRDRCAQEAGHRGQQRLEHGPGIGARLPSLLRDRLTPAMSASALAAPCTAMLSFADI